MVQTIVSQLLPNDTRSLLTLAIIVFFPRLGRDHGQIPGGVTLRGALRPGMGVELEEHVRRRRENDPGDQGRVAKTETPHGPSGTHRRTVRPGQRPVHAHRPGTVYTGLSSNRIVEVLGFTNDCRCFVPISKVTRTYTLRTYVNIRFNESRLNRDFVCDFALYLN